MLTLVLSVHPINMYICVGLCTFKICIIYWHDNIKMEELDTSPDSINMDIIKEENDRREVLHKIEDLVNILHMIYLFFIWQ